MYNLADLFLEKGLQRKAIPLLEKSVGIALDEINSSFVQEEIVLQKTNFYIKIFERLADCYVKIGRTKEALKVLESIKLASLRLRTLSVTDRPKRQRKLIAELIFKEAIVAIFGGQPQHTKIKKPQLQSITGDLKKLVSYLNDVPTALISFFNNGSDFTAIAVIPSKIFNYRIYGKPWNLKVKLQEEIPKMMKLLSDSSPLREKRLKQLCRAGYDMFLQPLISLLEKNQIKILAISAPPWANI